MIINKKNIYIRYDYALAFEFPRMINDINMWTYMLNRCPFWHHHSHFHATVISIALIWWFLQARIEVQPCHIAGYASSCSCKSYIKGKNLTRLLRFCPRILQLWINIVGMNHRSHKWITHMWGQISMALPSLVIKCQVHHKLRINDHGKAWSEQPFSRIHSANPCVPPLWCTWNM